MSEAYQIQKAQRSGRDLETKLAVIDQEATEGAMVRRNGGLMSRLFPDQIQREAARHRLTVAQSEYEFKETALRVLRDTQLQAMREMCKDQLIKWEMPRKRELTEFVMEQKIQLEHRLMALNDEINDRIMHAYEKAEKIPIPALQERAVEQVYATIDSYHEMAGRLQKQFQDIINEAARRYSE